MRGDGGSCGVSANEYSYTHRSPNKLWRSNSIFNLCLNRINKYAFVSLTRNTSVKCRTEGNYSHFYEEKHVIIKDQHKSARGVPPHTPIYIPHHWFIIKKRGKGFNLKSKHCFVCRLLRCALLCTIHVYCIVYNIVLMCRAVYKLNSYFSRGH